MARALGVIRLSELVDATTSPERQRQIITDAAERRGSTLVGWATDLDVSASKYPPTKRPELARWLETPDRYEEVIFWRLDRFVRSPADLTDMIRWSDRHGKNLVSATESFDLRDPLGQAMAYIAAVFAKMESDATSVRVKGTIAHLRKAGRWPAGRPPYGYNLAPNPDGPGWVLEINKAEANVIREAAARIVAGESANQIATDFNRRGVDPPNAAETRKRGKREPLWASNVLRVTLRRQSLLGHAVRDGQPIPGEDGQPVTQGPPILDLEDWQRVQTELESTALSRRRTNTPSLLLNVGYCGKVVDETTGAMCAAPLYRITTRNRPGGKKYGYYRCRSTLAEARETGNTCGAKQIRAEALEDAVNEAVLSRGDQPHYRLKVLPGGSAHARALAQVQQAINDLNNRDATGSITETEYQQKMGEARATRARLREADPGPDRVERIPTGKTVAEAWNELDTQGRRRWLMERGWRAYAHLDEDRELIVTVQPGDLLDDIEALKVL